MDALDATIAWFRERAEGGIPTSAAEFLDGAAKLAVLLQDLDEELVLAEMAVNRAVNGFMGAGNSAAAAKAQAKALPEYEVLLRLQAKRERISAFIQIAKRRSEIRY